MEQLGANSNDNASDSSCESDVSSTYHSDGEIITSILHTSYNISNEGKQDMQTDLFESERKQLAKFNLTVKDTGEIKGSKQSPQLVGLEQLFWDKIFIYTRPSFHRAISECRHIPMPESVKYVSCVFSSMKPVFLLTVVSNTSLHDEGVTEYKARVARAITQNVRLKGVSNFSVVSGIVSEDECNEMKLIKDRLEEFTTRTQLRTFSSSLEMNEGKCVAVIRCFLAMIGVEEELSKRPTFHWDEERDKNGQDENLVTEIPRVASSEPYNQINEQESDYNLRFRHSRQPNLRHNQRHESQCGRTSLSDPYQMQSDESSRQQPHRHGAQGPQDQLPMHSSSTVNSISSATRQFRPDEGYFSEGIPFRSLTDDDKARNGEQNKRDSNDENGKQDNGSKWGPQKDQQWNKEEIDNVRDELLVKYRKQAQNNLKILLFGPTGQGKSSLGNSFLSGLKEDEHVSNTFSVGSYTSNKSVTTAFNSVKILGDSWLIDMPGIFETKAITDARIEDIASGKVPFYTELSKNLRVKGIHTDPPPGKNDVACVVIVLNYDQEFGDEIRRQLDVVKKLAGKGVISYQLVLTHLDECDPEFKDNDRLPYIYDSESVQKAVQKMADEAGVPPYCISFVKNYVKETEKHPFTTLQHLRVLKKIVSAACDQRRKRQDMASMKRHYDDNYFYKYRVHIAVGLVLLAVLTMCMVSFGKS